MKICTKLHFTLKNKCRNTILKFDFLKVLFWTPQKECFWFLRKQPKTFFFFVFQLWFRFKNKRPTNVLLVWIFWKCTKKVIDFQKRHFDCFWRLIMVFCVFSKLSGLSTPFFSVRYVTFFSVRKKERSFLFCSFLEFLATYETQKNVPFFSLLF